MPLFTADALTDWAESWLAANTEALLVSDLASAEFSSAVARKHRAEGLGREEAMLAFAAFDRWTAISAQRVTMTPGDVTWAQDSLRRLHPPLRTPDALHLALARRLGATLLTFDRQLATAARTLSVPLAVP